MLTRCQRERASVRTGGRAQRNAQNYALYVLECRTHVLHHRKKGPEDKKYPPGRHGRAPAARSHRPAQGPMGPFVQQKREKEVSWPNPWYGPDAKQQLRCSLDWTSVAL